jgi:hypothetical protein
MPAKKNSKQKNCTPLDFESKLSAAAGNFSIGYLGGLDLCK